MTGRIVVAQIPDGTVIVDNPTDRPWIEMEFEVSDFEIAGQVGVISDSRSPRGRAITAVQGEQYGFGFSLAPMWTWKQEIRTELVEGEDEPFSIRLSWGVIELEDIGEPTTNLVRLIGEWINHPVADVFPETLTAAAVVIDGFVSEFPHAMLKAKLFLQAGAGETEDPGSYAEIFLHFDLPNQRVLLLEKAEEYRAALIGWLSGAYGQPDTGWLH